MGYPQAVVERKSAMTRGLVQTSRYSPGNMEPSALAQLFVGRDKLLRDVLHRIAASATGEEKHFILLVGQRGVGKTHFVWLVYDRLMGDAKYSLARTRLKIAFLNEEEWGVASFMDLIVRILRALETRHPDKDLSSQIENVYKQYGKDPEAAMRAASDALNKFVGKDVLLLICENLDELFKGLGDEGQKRWRAFIQEHPFWTILATTPALFSSIQLQESPFYGFFNIRELKRIDFETAVELLRKKALLDGKIDLVSFLQTPVGRARARGIHHLAGGHHRVYIVMSEFLTRESLDDLFQPFMDMVDELTPYYQDRIRQLAPQQRKIVEFLCRQEKPVTVKTVAERCLMSHQTAAKQLSELAAIGFVEKNPAGRETYCELSEPLLRVCIEVKDNNTEYFRLFVEFLRRWFSARELRVHYEAIEESPARRTIDRTHLEAALLACRTDTHDLLLDSLSTELVDALDEGRYSDAVAAGMRLVPEQGAALDYYGLATALTESGDYMLAASRAQEGISRYPNRWMLFHALANALFKQNKCADALEALNRSISLSDEKEWSRCLRGDVLMAMGRFEDVLRNEEDLLAKNPEHVHSYYLKVCALTELGRIDEAEVAAREITNGHPDWHLAWVGLAFVFHRSGNSEEEISALERALTLIPKDNQTRRLLGRALLDVGRYEDTYQNSQLILSRDSRDHKALNLAAWALWHMGKFPEAEDTAKKSFEISSDSVEAAHILFHALASQAKYREAVKALDHIISLNPSAVWPRGEKAEMLLKLHRPEAALLAVSDIDLSSSELSTKSRVDWHLLRAEILIRLGDYRGAGEVARNAQEIDHTKISGALVECKSAVGATGLKNEISSLSKILAREYPSEQDERAATIVAQTMILEAQLRGPGSLSRVSQQLREALDVSSRPKFLGEIITSFVSELFSTGGPRGSEWAAALPVFIQSFSDIPACRIPLSWLEVAQKYLESNDPTELLKVPLEQRTLLTEALR